MSDEIQRLLAMQATISEHAESKMEKIWATHRALVFSVGAIFAVGIGTATFTTWNTMSEMRASADAEIQRLRDELAEARKALEAQSKMEMSEFRETIERNYSEQTKALSADLEKISDAQLETLLSKTDSLVADMFANADVRKRIEVEIDKQINSITQANMEGRLEDAIQDRLSAIERLDEHQKTLESRVSFLESNRFSESLYRTKMAYLESMVDKSLTASFVSLRSLHTTLIMNSEDTKSASSRTVYSAEKSKIESACASVFAYDLSENLSASDPHLHPLHHIFEDGGPLHPNYMGPAGSQ